MTYTKEELLKYEFTELLREACDNEELAKAVKEHFNYEPLPVRKYLVKETIDKDGWLLQQDGAKIELYKHQLRAIKFMREREQMKGTKDARGLVGGVIGLYMGLGKTFTAMTYCLITPKTLNETPGDNRTYPTLIVASKIVMMEWRNEGFKKFFEDDKVKVLYYHRDYLGKNFDRVTYNDILKYDFVVTTYDVVCGAAKEGKYIEHCSIIGADDTLMARKIIGHKHRTIDQLQDPDVHGKRILFEIPWERIIADESHRFSNPKTQVFKAMIALYAKFKWGLTGTIIKNYVTDIWAQLFFCGYNSINSANEWKKKYDYVYKLHKLDEALLPIKLEDTEIVMPQKIITDVWKDFTVDEKGVYANILVLVKNAYGLMMKNKVEFAAVLALFTRLRQCAIAPFLITDESKRPKDRKKVKDPAKAKIKEDAYKRLQAAVPQSLSEWIKDRDGTAGINSTKMKEIVDDLAQGTAKKLCFSMFRGCLDLIAYALEKRYPGVKFLQIDGETSFDEREQILYVFKRDPTIKILLISYKIGSEGLNITCATEVKTVEPWWAPAVEEQAISRSYRPGQTQDVTVKRVYIKDTIEERILEICRDKKAMADDFLEGCATESTVGLDKWTLGKMLGVY